MINLFLESKNRKSPTLPYFLPVRLYINSTITDCVSNIVKGVQKYSTGTNLTPETEILNLCLEVPYIGYLGSIVSEEEC